MSPSIYDDLPEWGVPEATKEVEPPKRGLKCECGGKYRVVYTRPGANEKLVRRRECRECGERITTWEQAIGGR